MKRRTVLRNLRPRLTVVILSIVDVDRETSWQSTNGHDAKHIMPASSSITAAVTPTNTAAAAAT